MGNARRSIPIFHLNKQQTMINRQKEKKNLDFRKREKKQQNIWFSLRLHARSHTRPDTIDVQCNNGRVSKQTENKLITHQGSTSRYSIYAVHMQRNRRLFSFIFSSLFRSVFCFSRLRRRRCRRCGAHRSRRPREKRRQTRKTYIHTIALALAHTHTNVETQMSIECDPVLGVRIVSVTTSCHTKHIHISSSSSSFIVKRKKQYAFIRQIMPECVRSLTK